MYFATMSKRPAIFLRLTGLTIEEFNTIADKFTSIYGQYVHETFMTKKRQRVYGAGRHPELLSTQDKLFFILVYVRVYPLFILQGILFNLAESSAHDWVHRLLPLLNKALGANHVVPKRGRNLGELLAEFPELRELGILGDGVERPKRRPKDKDKQKEYYSGKKKRHTVKNTILVQPVNQRILHLGQTKPGKVHDKKCLDSELLESKEKIKGLGDSAFLGAGGAIAWTVPKRKPPGKELTNNEKEQNRAISSVRVKVEHAISGIKRNRSVADIYRNTKVGIDDLLMSIACGLHNIRITHRASYQGIV